MGPHMKTTVELSDALFIAAKTLAQQSHTSLRSLIEEGLRRVLNEAQNTVTPAFKLKDARVHGQEMLLCDPREWQQFEQEHVSGHLTQPSQ